MFCVVGSGRICQGGSPCYWIDGVFTRDFLGTENALAVSSHFRRHSRPLCERVLDMDKTLNTNLVMLVVTTLHGRIALAVAVTSNNSSTKTKIKIIRESSFLVWDKDNWMELLKKFKVLPDVMKVRVLDMYCFPLNSHQCEQALAMQLLSILMANSFQQSLIELCRVSFISSGYHC
jgi:hypothetical protein